LTSKAAERARKAEGLSRQPIVSSSHLAEGAATELSEFEFGLIVANHAFIRWITRCMAAAGMPDLSPTDILVLHHVQHRDRAKKLADICFTLNYEDAHVVSYSLKKLVGLGLILSEKQGKEVHYSISAAGRALVLRYREVRRRCLLPALDKDLDDLRAVGETAQLLRALSGLYDQAARAAASL
jgi:predicted MarR family transcription regulator